MSTERIRVLLVPDTRHWILGRIAMAIAEVNDWIEATVISRDVLKDLMDRDSSAVGPFDLVHFVVPGADRRAFSAFGAIMPVVTSMYHFDATQPMDLVERGDAICVVAREWRDWFCNRGSANDRVYLVPNGVDTRAFHPQPETVVAATRRRLGIPEGTPVIGFVGKPAAADYDRKGSDIFREAICLLRCQLPKVAALVIGPGWGTLASALGRSGIQCVNVPFVLEHRDLCRLYAAMDLYWVTARVEGGPCTLLEAMSTGTCVVTTPVGMARDIVRDGVNAVLVPHEDPVAVAERSFGLLADAELRTRIGSAGRSAILNGFAWEQTALGAWELYHAAFRNRAQRVGHRRGVPAMPLRLKSARREIDWNAWHLAGIQPQWRGWVRAMEDLSWMQILAELGATSSTRRLAVRTIRRRPFDAEVWRRVRRVFPNTRVLKAMSGLHGLLAAASRRRRGGRE